MGAGGSHPDGKIELKKLSPKPIEILQSKKDTRIIGRGGFGVVYAGTYGKRRVAVKISLIGGEDTLEKECLLLKDLKHNNLPEVIGYSVDPLCLVMELSEQGNLHTLLHDTKQPEMEWIRRLRIALDVAQCLLYLHSRPIPVIHRDLKPSNIILRADGSIFLIDFGISKEKVNEHTLGTKDIGTLQWTAPEMLNDEEETTTAIDIYGLGLILYGLLTRREPFQEMPKHKVYGAIKEGEKPVIPSEGSCSSMRGCPEGYQELMKECWNQEAKKRPSLTNVMSRLSQMILKEMTKNLDGKNSPVSDFTLLQQQAIHGDPLAQATLGFYYHYGFRGVKKDDSTAFKWYKLSSDQGHPYGTAGLGYLYVKGFHVKQDEKEGLRLIQLAVDQKSARGYYYLGFCYQFGHGVEKNYEKAIEYYRLSVEQGDLVAQNNLGYCYHVGQGVSKDYEESIRLRQLSAAQGFANAQYNLGCCYGGGQGVTQDYQEAYRFFQLAAVQGVADAQCALGSLYHNGTGVAASIPEALYWYRLAAEQGHKPARKQIGEILQGK